MENNEKRNSFQRIKRTGTMAAPSMLTIGNMGCGFFSILYSVNGNFHRGGWLILFALVFDMLDGRLARMLKAESSFGVEMDSLADLISFCAAPALLMYFMVLKDIRYLGAGVGAGVAFIYMLFGALRLAKFNAMAFAGVGSKKYFSGLPTPAGAAILSSFAVSYTIMNPGIRGSNIPFLEEWMLPHFYNLIALIMLLLALLMVSNIPYAAFKNKQKQRHYGALFILFLAVFVFLLIRYPQNVVLIVFCVYVLFGLIAVLFRAFKNLK